MRDKQEEEFMEMTARCERLLFKVCLFYTDRQPDNVRDMYQDIVCNLWQAWPSFRHESKENTWVYRVALNTAAAQLRKRSRTPSIVLLSDEMVSTLVDCRQDELSNRLYRLIDHLGKADKSLILLYLDKIPYNQIAEIVGVSEAAARKRVERIKQKLITLNNEDNGKII
ncbi:MAG: sigma-70 family RNA polymerase sigma factor [Bacteroidales bacterium]|nr:sigma-70 family RNA polymerase sigma factor [Bacteroidales bacterium]